MNLSLKNILWAAGIIATISGGIVGASKAWPIIEPGIQVWRGWLRDTTIVRVIKTEIRQNESEQRDLVRDIRVLEDELKSDKAASIPTFRSALQISIDRIRAQQVELEARNRRLHVELGE